MMYRCSHQGFKNSGQLLCSVVCGSPNTGYYGPQWCTSLMNFGKPIIFRCHSSSWVHLFVVNFPSDLIFLRMLINLAFCFMVGSSGMGSPLSPIIANIFMEHFEKQTLESAPHAPSLSKRFVDDTFVILETAYKEEFFHHINSLDSHIKFTVENTRDDGSIPFLDTLIKPNHDGSLQTKVYRKPTHTNQYLKWDSHHAISNKYSVISSLLHRAKDICSSQELLHEEQKQIQEALTLCKYPMWAITRMKTKISAPRNNRNNNQNNRPTFRSSITVPYNEELSETFKNLCKRYGIEVHFKSGKTIKDELVAPKDKDHITKKVV